jgi:Flp pilus assembly protein TadG
MKCASVLRSALNGRPIARNLAVGKACTRLLNKFGRDERGSVAIIFGLTIIVLCAMVGLAVDYARFVNARSQTIEATDAAVLAGARALQTNGGNQSAAESVAQTYYQQATKNRLSLVSDNVSFTVTPDGNAMIAQGNAEIATPFIHFAFLGTQKGETLPLLRANGADYSKALLAVGGNSNTNLETSLILDLSGSMAGEKISDLIDAAKNLVSIIVWKDQSQYTSKVALVPYAVAVNAGTYANAAHGPVTSGNCTTLGCKNYKFKNPSNQQNNFAISTCVSERTGTEAYTDKAPGAGTYVGFNYPASSNPCLKNAVLPLTSDVSTLNSQIGALQASGSTGGQVGVAWGFYTLSPNWSSVWPAASKPAPYSDLNVKINGQPKLKKIAVLMTDGEYNSPYCNGVISSDATTGSGNTSDHINCKAPNGSSYSQSLNTCTAMKTAGIEVYTVGFLVVDSQPARDLLSKCATDASHYYVSTTGDALKAAFNDIALKISSLYLSQ